MKPETLEIIRQFILLQLYAVGAHTLTEKRLAIGLKSDGVANPEIILPSQLHYLRDKALITTTDKTISPEVTQWRITAAGTDYLATNHLI